jgi:hypothetical protein
VPDPVAAGVACKNYDEKHYTHFGQKLQPPIGMAAVLIAGALALAIIFAEQRGLILIAARFNAGRRIPAYQALLQVLGHLRLLIELGLRHPGLRFSDHQLRRHH